jgi:uncharacterized membrane protein
MGNKLDPLRFHRKHEHLHGAFGSDRFGIVAEKIARFFGTPKYILSQTSFVILWIAFNAFGIIHHWDPYPFILLNLLFSTQAAYAAPLILLAQTRQADRDKASEEASAKLAQAEADRQAQDLAVNTELTRETHAMVQCLEHINAELNVLRQVMAPGIPNPAEGTDNGRPGSDPSSDSSSGDGKRPASAEHVSGVPGHDQPADAAGDP